jgi:hypothetical protein
LGRTRKNPIMRVKIKVAIILKTKAKTEGRIRPIRIVRREVDNVRSDEDLKVLSLYSLVFFTLLPYKVITLDLGSS